MDDAMERAAREEESARAWAAGRVEGDGSECAWRADVEKRPATRGHAIGGRDGQTRVTLPELRMEYGGKVWSMGSGQLAYTAELARAAAAARGSDTIVLMSTEWPEAEVLSSVSRALGMRGNVGKKLHGALRTEQGAAALQDVLAKRRSTYFLDWSRVELFLRNAPERLDGKAPAAYEIILAEAASRVYADFDHKIVPKSPSREEYLWQIAHALQKFLRDAYGADVPFSRFVVLDACTASKLSFHIVVAGTKLADAAARAQFKAQLKRFQSRDAALRDAHGATSVDADAEAAAAAAEDADADLAVYSRNQNFRVMGAAKRLKNNELRPRNSVEVDGARIEFAEASTMQLRETFVTYTEPGDAELVPLRPVPTGGGGGGGQRRVGGRRGATPRGGHVLRPPPGPLPAEAPAHEAAIFAALGAGGVPVSGSEWSCTDRDGWHLLVRPGGKWTCAWGSVHDAAAPNRFAARVNGLGDIEIKCCFTKDEHCCGKPFKLWPPPPGGGGGGLPDDTCAPPPDAAVKEAAARAALGGAVAPASGPACWAWHERKPGVGFSVMRWALASAWTAPGGEARAAGEHVTVNVYDGAVRVLTEATGWRHLQFAACHEWEEPADHVLQALLDDRGRPSIPSVDVPEGIRALILRAPVGLGKSVWAGGALKEPLQDPRKSALWIVPRVLLAGEAFRRFCEALGFSMYSDPTVRSFGRICARRVVCCLNSLHLVDVPLGGWDVVVWDEPNTCATSLYGMKAAQWPLDNFRAAVEALRVAKLALLLDAHADAAVVGALLEAADVPRAQQLWVQAERTQVNLQVRIVLARGHFELALTEIEAAVAAGKNIAVCAASRKVALRVAERVRKLGVTCEVLHGKSDDSEKKRLADLVTGTGGDLPRVFVYTGAFGVGNSITVAHFTEVWALGNPTVMRAEEFVQLMSRVRAAAVVHVHLPPDAWHPLRPPKPKKQQKNEEDAASDEAECEDQLQRDMWKPREFARARARAAVLLNAIAKLMERSSPPATADGHAEHVQAVATRHKAACAGNAAAILAELHGLTSQSAFLELMMTMLYEERNARANLAPDLERLMRQRGAAVTVEVESEDACPARNDMKAELKQENAEKKRARAEATALSDAEVRDALYQRDTKKQKLTEEVELRLDHAFVNVTYGDAVVPAQFDKLRKQETQQMFRLLCRLVPKPGDATQTLSEAIHAETRRPVRNQDSLFWHTRTPRGDTPFLLLGEQILLSLDMLPTALTPEALAAVTAASVERGPPTLELLERAMPHVEKVDLMRAQQEKEVKEAKKATERAQEQEGEGDEEEERNSEEANAGKQPKKRKTQAAKQRPAKKKKETPADDDHDGRVELLLDRLGRIRTAVKFTLGLDFHNAAAAHKLGRPKIGFKPDRLPATRVGLDFDATLPIPTRALYEQFTAWYKRATDIDFDQLQAAE